MRPLGTLPLIIRVPCCWATGCIPSSVAVLAYLSSFCFLLLMLMMPPLHNLSWHGQRGSTRFVPVSFAWMLPIGACASLPGFMPCLERWRSFLGIPSVRKTAPVYLPPGRKKNLANAAASSASLDVFSSSFISNALPCVAGPRLLHRLP